MNTWQRQHDGQSGMIENIYIYVFTGAKSSLLARCRTGGCNIMFERMVRRICLTFFLFCTQQAICTLVNALVEYIHAKLAVSSSY